MKIEDACLFFGFAVKKKKKRSCKLWLPSQLLL